MTALLPILLKITIVIFMLGNLLELGLRLDLKKAMAGLRDVRFVTLSLLWAFVLCPALAYLLGVVLPMSEPYAMGLLLLGLAPCAPLLPGMVDKAHGDVNYAASFMLLASAGTVVYMPLAVPLLVKGVSVSAWTVAKPMLFLVLIPLLVGIALQMQQPSTASFLQPSVKKVTAVDTLLMLLVVVVMVSPIRSPTRPWRWARCATTWAASSFARSSPGRQVERAASCSAIRKTTNRAPSQSSTCARRSARSRTPRGWKSCISWQSRTIVPPLSPVPHSDDAADQL